MYAFHVTIHARPDEAQPGEEIELAGGSYPTIDVPGGGPAAPFAMDFETVYEKLAALERLFIEPDGSFVWVAARDTGERYLPDVGPEWQLDGMLYDRGGWLLYVELKGRCPPQVFDRVLSALGWPQTPLTFQLQREAVWLDEAAFRRYAEANAPGAAP